MILNDKGVKFLISQEGCIHNVYLDQVGLPTIGVGHLLTKSELKSGKIYINEIPILYRNGLSDELCMQLLRKDILPVENLVDYNLHVPVNQDQFNVLVSFTFNVGNTAFMQSTLLKKLNNNEYDQVPIQLRRWVHDYNGDVVQDLIVRRENEIKLWNGERNV